jgi:PAS domain S-box-containing protein
VALKLLTSRRINVSEPTIQTLHVLHLEDDRDYTHLVKALLESDGLNPTIRVASTGQEFEAALNSEQFDIILADYQLPGYNGLLALNYAISKTPETPFLLVSGTIGEQAAIESLRAGATDYVLKVWPERLVPAIRRAVQESRERDSRRKAECELVRHEKYFQALTENSLDVITTLDAMGTVMYCSPSIKRVLGYEPAEFIGRSAFDVCHPDDVERLRQLFAEALTDTNELGTRNFERAMRTGRGAILNRWGRVGSTTLRSSRGSAFARRDGPKIGPKQLAGEREPLSDHFQ